jgi:hypothetical protein
VPELASLSRHDETIVYGECGSPKEGHDDEDHEFEGGERVRP